MLTLRQRRAIVRRAKALLADDLDFTCYLGEDYQEHVDEEPIKAWDESEHPRVPAGSPDGGQFGEGGGSGEVATESNPIGVYPKYAAMDMDELKKHLRDNANIILNDEMPGASVKDTKRAREIAATLATSIDRLYKNGDFIRQSMLKGGIRNQGITVTLVKGKVLEAKESGGSRAFARYNKGTNTITIASGLRLKARSSKPTIGQFNVGTDFETVLSHEIGHSISGKILIAAGVDSLTDVFHSKPKAYWEKNVSGYGSKNPVELFAEAFAAYTHPGYGKSKGIAPELVDIFEKAGIKRSQS